MGLLLEVLTGKGLSSEGVLYSENTLNSVLSPQFRPHENFVGISHGLWESNEVEYNSKILPIRSLGHGGDMLGFSATLQIFLDYNTGIFVATNRNAESGGGRVTLGKDVSQFVAKSLYGRSASKSITVPQVNHQLDLSEYAGNYYYGVFCHTCSDDEFKKGGWQRGKAFVVKSNNGTLLINQDTYIPNGNDIFIRADGNRKVFFGRSNDNKISFYVYSNSPSTFERVED